MSTLETDLETALLNAMMGDPWGSLLKGRLETTARGVLYRHGVRDARVIAKMGRQGVEIDVILPPGPARVRTLRITLG